MVGLNENRHVLVQTTSRYFLWIGAADIAAATPRAADTISDAVVADTAATAATADIAAVAAVATNTASMPIVYALATNTASMPIVYAVGGLFEFVATNVASFFFLSPHLRAPLATALRSEFSS